MSRHRNIRNYDYEDDLQDDYSDQEDLYEDDIQKTIAQIQEIVGNDVPHERIRQSLDRVNYNMERAIDFLLQGTPKPPIPFQMNQLELRRVDDIIDGTMIKENDSRISIQKEEVILISEFLKLDFISEVEFNRDSITIPFVPSIIPYKVEPIITSKNLLILSSKDIPIVDTPIIPQFNTPKPSAPMPFPSFPFNIPKPNTNISLKQTSVANSTPTPSLLSLASTAKKPLNLSNILSPSLNPSTSSNPSSLFNIISPKPGSSLLLNLSQNKVPSLESLALNNSTTLSNPIPFTNSSPLFKLPTISSCHPSAFASLLDSKHRPRKPPTISLEQTNQLDNSFHFDTPSPDDIVIQTRLKQNSQPKPTLQPKPNKPIPTKTDQKPLTNTMNKLKLQDKSKPQSKSLDQIIKEPSPLMKSKSKLIDVIKEYDANTPLKDQLNMVVVGHVDAGKSTIMGHVLNLLGNIDHKQMRRFEKQSEEIKKPSFKFAWVLDSSEEERNRGVTIDVGLFSFETEHKFITLLDSPGHRDFIPNMISGTSQADVALLVVDAQDFETGFQNGGQTKEHGLLLRSLGISKVAVIANKMDMVDWDSSRFEFIKSQTSQFLIQTAGFKQSQLLFIPCSGYSGENLITRSDPRLDWYTGPTLVQTIDTFPTPKRPMDGALRMSISDVQKGGLSGSTVTISGRIESGSLQIGQPVLVIPTCTPAITKSITLSEEPKKWAVAGSHISVGLVGIDPTHISTGFSVCSPDSPIPITSYFKAQIITFDLNVPLTIGVPVLFYHLSLSEPGFLSGLYSLVDKNGTILKKNPRFIGKNSNAIVFIKLERPVGIELFSVSKAFGRFTLRVGPNTVAAGIVVEILSTEKGRRVDEQMED